MNNELSSYRIIRGMQRASRAVEDQVERAEARAEMWCNLLAEFVLCLCLFAGLFYICV